MSGVTAVIPVHNGSALLAELLVSMKEQRAPFTRILVIDNASTDGAADLARREGCEVAGMGSNTGFARAVNHGWRMSDTEWVAILNSDARLEPHWLERLLAVTEGASFATGKILRAQDPSVIDGTYDLMSGAGCAWRVMHGEADDDRESGVKKIAMTSATACLYRRQVLERLGGFDETFESYLEDVDLGLRCVREGLWGVYVPQAVAHHHGSETFGAWSGRVVRLIARNQVRLIARHYDRKLYRENRWRICWGQALWGAVALRHGAGAAWLRGKWEGLRSFRLEGLPSAELRRFLEESEREIAARAQGGYWKWYFRLTARIRASD